MDGIFPNILIYFYGVFMWVWDMGKNTHEMLQNIRRVRGNALTTQVDFGAFNQLPKLVKKAVLTDLEIEIIYLGVSLNGGFSPKSSILKWVFHYFHHPFWEFSPYFWISTHFEGSFYWSKKSHTNKKVTPCFVLRRCGLKIFSKNDLSTIGNWLPGWFVVPKNTVT